MDHTVLTTKGEKTTKKINLNKNIFGIEPNEHVVYLDVKRILAHQRQGTHKTKEKGEITASTRKIMRQKGTGNARKGSVKSNILRGGGKTFGPQPRDYKLKINKKVKKLARKSVLSDKAQNKNILVIENFILKTPKTKEYQKILLSLQLNNQKTLLVLPKTDHNIIKATKNLPKASITTADKANTYNLLNAQTIIFTEDAIQTIEKILIA